MLTPEFPYSPHNNPLPKKKSSFEAEDFEKAFKREVKTAETKRPDLAVSNVRGHGSATLNSPFAKRPNFHRSEASVVKKVESIQHLLITDTEAKAIKEGKEIKVQASKIVADLKEGSIVELMPDTLKPIKAEVKGIENHEKTSSFVVVGPLTKGELKTHELKP